MVKNNYNLCKEYIPSTQVLFLLNLLIYLGKCQAQNVPNINDPFPPNVGPEPPTTTMGPYLGCPDVCTSAWDRTQGIIADLERKINDMNFTLQTKLNTLPSSGGGGSSSPDLSLRVANLELFLPGNITQVTDKLTTDLTMATGQIDSQMVEVQRNLENRINELQRSPSSGGGGNVGGGADTVYRNVTMRLESLENVKVQRLIDENNVWRKNFEVVNRTFSKMRKSQYSNDVILVG